MSFSDEVWRRCPSPIVCVSNLANSILIVVMGQYLRSRVFARNVATKLRLVNSGLGLDSQALPLQGVG